MAEEIAVENNRISNFEWIVTLTLDRVTLHTVVHHSSTSTYMSNFIEIENFLWTDGPMAISDARTHVRTYVRRLYLRRYGRTDIWDRLYWVCDRAARLGADAGTQQPRGQISMPALFWLARSPVAAASDCSRCRSSRSRQLRVELRVESTVSDSNSRTRRNSILFDVLSVY